jgi:conjugative relaxase-like TrwC/TraI family protein
MLSIGKLGIGHCAYYERSVAQGADDYYSGKGEQHGTYIGRGTSDLGLDGVLANGDLNDLMRGRLPDGSQWHDRQHQHKLAPRRLKLKNGCVVEQKAPQPTAAFDLTFSAPKSVSVLWGLSDGPVAEDIKQAHSEAVRQAMDYMERTACITRRGRGGREHIRGDGFVGASFVHRTSRAGDPQLHTHVVIANATRATSIVRGHEQQRYTALHGAALYREAKTCGHLYQTVLRAELTRRLGIEWGPVERGVAEIVGVDHELCSTFSKRADEIANQLALTGTSSASAATAAAIDTRAAKDYSVDGAHLKERWIGEAAEFNLPDPLDSINRAPRSPRSSLPDDASVRTLADQLFSPEGLTQSESTFSRRDVLRAVADALPEGATVAHIEYLTDRLLDLSHEQTVMLTRPDQPLPRGVVRRADGTTIADGRVDLPFTTRELLAAECAVLDSMRDRADDRIAIVPQASVRDLIAGHEVPLAPEQRQMVESLTTSGAGMQAVVGLAGSGKTTSLAVAHEAWIREGIEVRGCALADNAARNLESETSIPSRTIATLHVWASPDSEAPTPDKAFPPGGVLIVDEAGMVATRDLAFLVEGCAANDTKLVLIGDHLQLPEIEAGGTFKGLVHRFEREDRIERLTNNRRQHESWERAALANLRNGDVGHAIAEYADQGRVVAGADAAGLRRQLAADWLEARKTNKHVAMIAYTNRDVAALNEHARTLLDDAGELGSERREFAGREWAVGDEILCLRNNRHLDLSNGTRGHVTTVDRTGLTIRTDDGRNLAVPRHYLEQGHASYGYAATGHKTQGRTIHGEAFVLASEHISREWMYVAMSRATDSSRIYVDTIGIDPSTGRPLTRTEQLHAGLLELHDLASRSDARTMAADYDADRLTPRDELRLHVRDAEQLALRQPTAPVRSHEPSPREAPPPSPSRRDIPR